MTEAIGSSVKSSCAVVIGLDNYVDAVRDEVRSFLAAWKEQYRSYIKLKSRQLEESVNSSCVYSERPSRRARITAIENITKLLTEEDTFRKPTALPRTKAKKLVKDVPEIIIEDVSNVALKEPPKVVKTEKNSAKQSVTKTKSRKKVKDANIARESEPNANVSHSNVETISNTSTERWSKRQKSQITKNESIITEVIVEEAEVVPDEPQVTEVAADAEKSVEIIQDEECPPFSPVLAPTETLTVINESADESSDTVSPTITKKISATKKSKGESNSLFPECDLNSTITLKKSNEDRRTRTRSKRSPFNESSSNAAVENENIPAPSPDAFLNATVVITKKSEQSDYFQAPLPVVKPVVEVAYDAFGNPIERNTATRTKVITAPSFNVLPNAVDGRPVRTRTKVRRFGVAEDKEQPNSPKGSVNAAETSHRGTRTKKKSANKDKSSENIKELAAISKKSKACRASQIFQKTSSKLPPSSQKFKTPLSTVTNQLHGKRPFILISPATKDYPSSQKKYRPNEQSRMIIKPVEGQLNEEKEAKMKSKILKEEAATLKKQEEIARRQEQLKQKNKEKLMRAKECRAKIEEEKHEMIVQTEREKEMKRLLALKEREEKQKAEMNKKKLMIEKKLAENEERRRIEEEQRLAKIREMEMEQQRQQLEKQRQMELEEKRAKERAEERKKAMEVEELRKMKLAQASKAQAVKKKKYDGLYLPRNENDLGLEDEMSENSDEEECERPKRPSPKWVEGAKKGHPLMNFITSQQMQFFMPLPSKTPNVDRMLNLTPKRALRRTSSAIWNTTIVASP